MRAAILVAALGGCAYTGTFECFESKQCLAPGGAEGVCVSGSCAYPDSACMAGFRFADSAADELSGSCLESVPPADCAAWMPRHFMPCDVPTPLGPVAITAARTYNTDTGAFDVSIPHTSVLLEQEAGGTMVRVISATTFSVDIGITLTVTGSVPLVIAGWDSITVAGRIDASSKRGGATGPHANAGACTAPTAGAVAITRGSGGGGGGAFQGAGGVGGLGGYPMQAMGGIGGIAAPTPITSRIRGGCPGAASGPAGPGAVAPATATSVGAPGAGGGAVQLTARRSISITGTILVGGAGGSGAPFASSSGGGGGGSGGYIGLEAPMIMMSGSLAANGGAGGGGGSDTTGGGHGADGVVGATAARGGGGGAVTTPGGPGCEGTGGNGGAGTGIAGGAASNNAGLCGGGGGGGAVGVIAVRSAAYVPTAAANISPPVTIVTP